VSVLYDAGVLIAAERNDREVWAEHRARLELDVLPRSTAPVLAQVSRSRRQVQLRRFLRGCEIQGFSLGEAHEVGALLGRAQKSDVVDAHLAIVASRSSSTVLTTDPDDLQALSEQLSTPLPIRRI
jgi:predicted nucleic acid-binding protein